MIAGLLLVGAAVVILGVAWIGVLAADRRAARMAREAYRATLRDDNPVAATRLQTGRRR